MRASRRRFLQLAGATAASLPFFRLLERSAIADGPAPLRFAAFIDPHGTRLDRWRPQGSETNFSLSFPNAILAPFAPIQHKCLILDGLAIKPVTIGHNAYSAALTGVGEEVAALGSINVPSTHQSIDQYLANAVGSATPIRSIELASGESNNYKPMFSWSSVPASTNDGAVTAIPRLNNPYDVFNFLFAQLDGGGDDSGRAFALKKSRLDYVASDLARLEKRVGAVEKQKLAQHLQAIRDIEKQLDGFQSAVCSKPLAPNLPLPTSGHLDPGYVDTVAIDGDIRASMVDMMAQAFACDLTRIATFQMASTDDVRPMPYASPSLSSENIENGDLHLVAHDQESYTGPDGDSGTSKIALCHNYYASVVARFARALDEIPEGDGTVLDHTCILWISSMSRSDDHFNSNVPCMLIGGANGYFRTGRYLKYAPLATDDSFPNDSPLLTSHNHLLVSILNAFGLPDQTFGSSDVSGPLANLT